MEQKLFKCSKLPLQKNPTQEEHPTPHSDVSSSSPFGLKFVCSEGCSVQWPGSEGAADIPEGSAATQQDLSRLRMGQREAW